MWPNMWRRKFGSFAMRSLIATHPARFLRDVYVNLGTVVASECPPGRNAY